MLKRLLLAALAALVFAGPALAGTTSLQSAYSNGVQTEVTLTDLTTTSVVTSTTTDASRFVLFNLEINNTTSRTATVILKVKVDGGSTSTQTVEVAAGTPHTIQLPHMYTGLSLGSHSFTATVTQNTSGPLIFTTNTYLGVYGPAEAGFSVTSAAADTAVALATNPADCSANQYAKAIAANGDLTCEQVTVATLANTATALASNPADCSANQFANAIAASGDLTCSAIPNAATTATSANTASTIVARDASGNFTAGTITAALTGNASTATALAANGTNCSAGQFPLGVDASGNAEGCSSSVGGNAATATALAANGTNCSAGQFPLGVDASGNSESCSSSLSGNASTATALASNPTDCSANQYAKAIDASGNLTCEQVAIATALASNPTDCGAGTKATAIDASGNLTCSAVSLTADVSGTLPVANGGTGLASGTSGGILGYTASGTLASSGALTANLPVIGGGAGSTPTVGTRSGNTTAFVTTTGSITSGHCVQWDASGNAVDSGAACGGGGSTKPFITWTAQQGFPCSTGATLSTLNNNPVLAFDDSADECQCYRGVLNGYAGGGLSVKIMWSASATSGTVGWLSAFERQDDSGTDLDAGDSFGTENSASVTVPGTSGQLKYTTIAHTNGAQIDSLADGEAFRVRTCRDGNGSTVTDSATGDAYEWSVVVFEP
jgi:hypothetical protein